MRAVLLIAAAAVLASAPSVLGADPEVQVLTRTPAAAAMSVHVEPMCSEFKISSSEAVLRWDVDRSRAPKAAGVDELAETNEFRVDFTPYPRGMERGEFTTVKVARDSVADPTAHLDLPAGAKAANAGRELVLGDLQPGVTYRTRVLALTERGWIASEEVMFRAPICPVDLSEDDEGGAR